MVGLRIEGQRARQLERVEGVAARELVDAQQHGTRQRAAEAHADHAVQRSAAERADADPCGRVRAAGRRPGASRAGQARAGEMRPGAAARWPSRRKAYASRGRRGGVEPLDVVDRQDEPTRPAQRPQRAEHGCRHRSGIHRGVGGRSAQECHLQGGGLGRRQAVEGLVHHRRQQIAQGGEGQPCLRQRRAGDENPRVTLGRCGGRLAPQRRLADARLALQHERREPLARREGPDQGEFVLAPDDLDRSGHRTGPPAWRSRPARIRSCMASPRRRYHARGRPTSRRSMSGGFHVSPCWRRA